jgi:hypothetical protein
MSLGRGAYLVHFSESSRLGVFQGLSQAFVLARDFFMPFGKTAAFFHQVAHGFHKLIDFLLL